MNMSEANGQVHGIANGVGNGDTGLQTIKEEQEDDSDQGIEVCECCHEFQCKHCLSQRET